MISPILAMHIPDGFVSLPVGAFGWLLLVLLLAVALRQTRQQLDERQIPLIGVLAAFIFAAQMINFLVAGGTSGHLLGGALIAILLGPWASLLVMTSVLAVQALVFQDGGLVALGFNAPSKAFRGGRQCGERGGGFTLSHGEGVVLSPFVGGGDSGLDLLRSQALGRVGEDRAIRRELSVEGVSARAGHQ